MKFNVNDAMYSYNIYGKGDPIVLLHGFTGSSNTWSEFIREYHVEYQFITIDLPGHGQTCTKNPRTMEACCQDLNLLFQYLQLDSFHLLGYSMGGRTALSYAMLYPEKVKSLILESASPGLVRLDEQAKRRLHDEMLAKKLETEGIESFIDFWENIPLFETQNKLPMTKKKQIRKERLSHSVEGLANSLRYMGTGTQPSWWEDLHRFNKPVLLLVGEWDDKFIGINKRMDYRFPESQLIVVENAGHAIHVEQPVIFGKLVIRFINPI